MTFGRRLLAAAACVPLLAALGACSEDEPEPKFAPSESPTPTETTTPEPAAWEEKSEDGAVAFAEHWVDVFNEAQCFRETAMRLRALSTDACVSRAQTSRIRFDELYAERRLLSRATGWSILHSVPAQRLARTRRLVALRIDQAPQSHS